MSFVLVVNIRIKPENVDGFRSKLFDNAREARKEPGCRQFEVLVDPKDRTKIMLFEVYDDEKAFEAHQATPHFKKYLVIRLIPWNTDAADRATRFVRDTEFGDHAILGNFQGPERPNFRDYQ
jgi:(4S)-4-hydroxy-5-phosphonooxypentane-2,3-dione isomerase